MDALCFPGEALDLLPPGSRWWIGSLGGVPVCYAGAYGTGKKWSLTRAGVLAEHRGHGLQRRLVRARERHARRRGAKQVSSYTHAGNYPSANNLIACGYRLTKHWRSGGSTFLTWSKDFA